MKKLKFDGGVTRLRSHNSYVGEAMGWPRSWVGKEPILRPNGKPSEVGQTLIVIW